MRIAAGAAEQVDRRNTAPGAIPTDYPEKF